MLQREVESKLKEHSSQLEQIATLSVVVFGAKGDGITDDTQAIKNAFLKLDDGYTIKFEKNKTYVIDSVITTTLSKTNNINVDFNGSTIKLKSQKNYYTNGLLGFKFDKTKTHTIATVKNGNYDISANAPNFGENISDSELFGGGGVLFFYGARNVNVENCNFEDVFFSSAINIMYSDIVTIKNCNGVRVGGMAGVSSGDRAGDAIYLGKLGVYGDDSSNIGGNDTLNKEVSVLISNCNFSSYEAIENMYPNNASAINGCKSGRCGIVLGEYSSNLKNKKIKLENTFFNNYQRVLHIEFTKGWDILVENCEFLNYGDALFVTHDNTWRSIICKNVKFIKNIDVRGMFTSSGYVFYTGIVDQYKSENLLKFDNCEFVGKIKLIRGNTTYYSIFDNCKMVSDFMYIDNSRARFLNCNLKANKSKVDSSIIDMNGVYLEIGYLNNTESNYFFGSSVSGTTKQELGRTSIFNGCVFKNTSIGFNNGNSLKIINCKYILDEKFNPKTYLNVSVGGIIYLGYKDNVELFEGNTVTNIRNDNLPLDLLNWTLSAENISGRCVIKNNVFSGCKINTSNIGSFSLNILENKFVLNGKNITNFIKSISGNILLNNNIFEGLTTGEYSSTGIIKNNYRLSNNTLVEIS